MRLKNWQILALGLLIYLAGRWWWNRPMAALSASPPAMGPEPIQEIMAVAGSRLLTRHEDVSRIKLTHRFEISGEAVAVTNYRWSFTNPYYDVDLGLAWGPRIQDYKKKLKFRQGARWLMWSYKESLDTETLQDIQTHVGNLHLIPAEGRPEIKKAVPWIETGDLVRVKGFLVEISGPSGEIIAVSSTSRDDTGNGACEIVWVEELQIGGKIYR